MSNLIDELADANARLSKMNKELDGLQEKLLGKLKQDAVRLRVTKLRTEIDMAKSDIEARTVMAQATGRKPEVADLLRKINECEQELKELGLPSEETPRKRRWQFWKR